MADIELVIKIPEEKYRIILNHTEEIIDESSFVEPRYLYKAVLDGTQLPKGHGRVIDESKITKCEQVGLIIKDGNITHCIKTDAPTIIKESRK